MEDIAKPKAEEEDKEMVVDAEEGDDDKSILTVDCKMGAEEIRVREKIAELAKEHLDNEELDIDSFETMQEIEKKLATKIRETLNADFGKNWSVIVGKRFAVGAGLRENDKFGNFKIGFFNVLVFQINQVPAA